MAERNDILAVIHAQIQAQLEPQGLQYDPGTGTVSRLPPPSQPQQPLVMRQIAAKQKANEYRERGLQPPPEVEEEFRAVLGEMQSTSQDPRAPRRAELAGQYSAAEETLLRAAASGDEEEMRRASGVMQGIEAEQEDLSRSFRGGPGTLDYEVAVDREPYRYGQQFDPESRSMDRGTGYGGGAVLSDLRAKQTIDPFDGRLQGNQAILPEQFRLGGADFAGPPRAPITTIDPFPGYMTGDERAAAAPMMDETGMLRTGIASTPLSQEEIQAEMADFPQRKKKEGIAATAPEDPGEEGAGFGSWRRFARGSEMPDLRYKLKARF
jgi:hypothetical protein